MGAKSAGTDEGVHRKLLGALTLWPVVYVLFFVIVVVIASSQGDGDPDNSEFIIPFGVLLGLHLGTMLMVIALLIVYIRDAYSNSRINENKRAFWAVVLFMGNMIAMPIYWWLYIRPGSEEPGPLANSSSASGSAQ